MRFHYSAGLVGIPVVILIITWYMAKVVALTTGYFPLVYLLLAASCVVGFVFLYIRSFAQHIFPELEGIVTIGMNAMYDHLLDKVEKHADRPDPIGKFEYPAYIDNSHRGIIEYIPRFQHQRKVYLQHYRFIIEELSKKDCHYGLVIEQIEELKDLLK